MVQRLSVFAKPKARKGHYTIRDNFLRSWLDALAEPTAAINFRSLVSLAGQLYEERSRLGLVDFPLTSRIEGWWNRSDTEIAQVALDETAQRCGSLAANDPLRRWWRIWAALMAMWPGFPAPFPDSQSGRWRRWRSPPL